MADRPQTFPEVLAAAIDDLVENGFDSMERIDRWTRELRLAAERSLVSPASMEQQLRDALAAVYRKMVDQGGVFRFNPGVERFTLEKIKPALRNELDRRIMASANLIKLNRTEAIEKTLRRFQGWSTSIPAGGISAESKRDVKANVRKALSQLPFEERRVLIDQGHKLTAALSEIVASDGGAIAGRWHSHWRQAGYDYREEHKERDEQVYLVRDSWAHRAGYVKKGSAGYYDEITAAGQEPYCRCYVTWLYNLRDLPETMLTAKGSSALASVQGREEVRSARQARADALETDDGNDRFAFQDNMILFHKAEDLDRLGYLRGLKRVRAIPDRDKWHAKYDEDEDEIELETKFYEKPRAEQMRILLHEAGHRGQEVDPEAYEAFKRLGLNRESAFVAMANPTHLKGFARRGDVDGGFAAEVFAESYARWTLGLDMPGELQLFWDERGKTVSDRSTPAEAEYIATWPNKITRCQRCTMFIRLRAGTMENACSAVAGPISAHGHCKHFVIGHGMSIFPTDKEVPKNDIPVPVDRDHDVKWMFVVSKDCDRLYVDRTLPRAVTIKGKTFDPAELGWAHEHGEFLYMLKLIAAFIDRHRRGPDEAEKVAIYDFAHTHGGNPAEKARAEEMGVDWDGWEAWSRGELARLENRRIANPPPDPHVEPTGHRRHEIMEAVA
jgi:hypothetical protein